MIGTMYIYTYIKLCFPLQTDATKDDVVVVVVVVVVVGSSR